jgi:hypothetical protein
VLLGVDGISDFVQLYAFDALMLDGEDLRQLPLSMRKTSLARLLARRPNGIFLAPFEQGDIGPDLFRKACEFKLEGGWAPLCRQVSGPGCRCPRRKENHRRSRPRDADNNASGRR